MPLPENEAFNINFVKTVETFKCLYDPSTPDYSSKEKQDKAWSRVAQIFSSTRSDCKLRWKYLRGGLTRYVKKKKSSKSIQQFYLWDCMQFVLPYLKSRCLTKTGTYVNSGPSVVDDENPNNTDCDPEVRVREDDGLCEDLKGEPRSQSPTLSQQKEPERTNQKSENTTERGRKRARSPIEDSPVRDFHSPQRKGQCDCCHCQTKSKSNFVGKRDRSNPDLDFFKSILSDVADLNASQKRRFKQKVLQLLDEFSSEVADTQTPASVGSPSTSCGNNSVQCRQSTPPVDCSCQNPKVLDPRVYITSQASRMDVQHQDPNTYTVFKQL